MEADNFAFLKTLYMQKMTQPQNWHEFWIQRCLTLALRGLGYCSPNPLVGAILLRPKNHSHANTLKMGNADNRQQDFANWQQYFEILGEGWHEAYGLRHAEAMAFDTARQAGYSTQDLAEATLYCNLEPCCFEDCNKKQPSCTQRILREGVKQIVIANQDPNPRVQGLGLSTLRTAGIHIQQGVFQYQAAYINQGFFRSMKEGRARVILKIAQSLDGYVATKSGHSQWITGLEARKQVQALRAICDAVMVGKNTLLSDNPNLLLRNQSKPKIKQPYRIVWDSQLSSFVTNNKLQFYNDEYQKQSILIHQNTAPQDKQAALLKTEVHSLALAGELNQTKNLLKALQSLNQKPWHIQNILLEGGAALNSSLLNAGLVDELFCFTSPMLIGGNGLSSTSQLFAEQNTVKISDALQLQEASYTLIPEDETIETLCHGYLKPLYVP